MLPWQPFCCWVYFLSFIVAIRQFALVKLIQRCNALWAAHEFQADHLPVLICLKSLSRPPAESAFFRSAPRTRTPAISKAGGPQISDLVYVRSETRNSSGCQRLQLQWNFTTTAHKLEVARVRVLGQPTLALVSFAAVIRVVTQRSSPLTAAHERDTFLSLCF